MSKNQTWLSLMATIALATVPVFAQGTNQSAAAQPVAPVAQAAATPAAHPIVSGSKQKTAGIIAQSEADGFVLRQPGGGELPVKLTAGTQIVEKKSNPFRGAKKYAPTQLTRGLEVEVEGRSDAAGALVADKIRFTGGALKTAEVVDTRVVPVENRMGTAETRLKASEENAKRLSGQLEELNVIATTARGEAKGAQQTADAAHTRVTATNERITSIDDYQPVQSSSVLFKVGSAVLSPEAKATLDQMASQAKTQKGFVIEVAGFASKDGAEALNQRLSDMRAQAVVRYLAQQQDIPLRRIITPFGYGISHPVADNSTRTGRQENRRVEVKLLVSKGLTMSASADPVAPAPQTAPMNTPNQ